MQSFDARLDRLEREIEAAEDLSAITRLQRTYGYYLDKGLWQDLAELFTEGAVANDPVGVFVGRESIAKRFLNVGELASSGCRTGGSIATGCSRWRRPTRAPRAASAISGIRPIGRAT